MEKYIEILITWIILFIVFFLIAPYFDTSGYYQEINFARIIYGIWYATILAGASYAGFNEYHEMIKRKKKAEKTDTDRYKDYTAYSSILGSIGINLFFISNIIFLLPLISYIIVAVLGIIALYFRREAKKKGVKTISSTLLSIGCAFLGIICSLASIIYIGIIF